MLLYSRPHARPHGGAPGDARVGVDAGATLSLGFALAPRKVPRPRVARRLRASRERPGVLLGAVPNLDVATSDAVAAPRARAPPHARAPPSERRRPPDSEDASLSRTPLDPGAVRSPRPGDRVSGDGSRDWGVLVLLAAAAIFVCYADRSNISTAIIPMAHQFGWDKIREGGVLSAFFYGYALTQLLGGRLADRVGGKPVLLFGVLAWSLATFVTPEAAAAGVAPLLIARVTLGAGEGVAFPAVHALIARHVPKERQTTARRRPSAAASYAGAAFAFGVTPSIVVNGGWEAAFYTFGAAAVVWVPLWVPARFAVVNDEFVDGSGRRVPSVSASRILIRDARSIGSRSGRV